MYQSTFQSTVQEDSLYPHPLQHLLFVDFLMMAIPTSVSFDCSFDFHFSNKTLCVCVCVCLCELLSSVVSHSCDPMDYSLPGSPSMGLSSQEHWSHSHSLLYGVFLTQGLNQISLIAGRFLTTRGVRKSQWYIQFIWDQSLSHVQLYKTPWIAACQASLSITNSWSLLILMSIESMMPSIQPSHPLSSPSPPTFNLSQHQGLFQGVNSSHQVAKVLEFQLQHQSFQWIFRTDFL